MPLYQHHFLDEAKCTVAIWQITESEEELVAPLPNGSQLLDEAHTRFKAAGRRLEWLAVRRLLHESGISSPIGYHPSGRPYLTDDPHHISISHTRGYAAIALHRNAPVGIDIEQRTDKVCRVQDKFLSPEEKHFLPLLRNRVEALLVIWTAKESIFKLIDREGIDFSAHFHLSPFTVAEEGILSAHETFTADQLTFRLHYRIHSDFIILVSVKP